jgi:hypothetical protein
MRYLIFPVLSILFFTTAQLSAESSSRDSRKRLCMKPNGKIVIRNRRCLKMQTEVDAESLLALVEGSVASIEGAQGPKGEQGIPGIQGPVGPQGAKGDDGKTGARGEEGERGEKGETGSTGTKGEKGETGATGPQGPGGATVIGQVPGCPDIDANGLAVAIEGTSFVSTVNASRNYSIAHVTPGTYLISLKLYGNHIVGTSLIVTDDSTINMGTVLNFFDCGVNLPDTPTA